MRVASLHWAGEVILGDDVDQHGYKEIEVYP